MTLKIVWLYAKDMNIYGDYGNILALKKRAELRGAKTEIVEYNPGDDFPDDADIVIGGGGQDSGQGQVCADLLKIAPKLKKLAQNGVPMLMICGLYQLFGDFFEPNEQEKIAGIGIFKGMKTYGGTRRLIGNIIEESSDFGEIIGYENHSGQTYLSEKTKPLGKIRKGEGNNFVGDHEGARYKNVIGTYLHGAILPKNPAISDFLLEKALRNRGEELPEISKKVFPDFEKLERITEQARQIAKKRPR
ncbi:MAG: glutamine amidotransferase [bacterium]|nr:glutamine amidotransferase [bacterium]